MVMEETLLQFIQSKPIALRIKTHGKGYDGNIMIPRDATKRAT